MENKPLHILLISFFFPPYKGVGAARAYYWWQNIEHLSNGRYLCDVLTASKGPDLKRLFRLDCGKSSLQWISRLMRFIIFKHQAYKIIILTGGPFTHFLIAPFLKILFRKIVVLDYRDPFANNPVFQPPMLKLITTRAMEYIVNLSADLIVTVNEYCSKLLCTKSPPNIELIDNGYDEKTEVSNIHFQLPTKYIVLPGSFSHGRSLKDFWEALNAMEEQIFLVHVGSVKLNTQSDRYQFLGEKNYGETLGIIETSELGLIFVSGHPYESTTKVFDYLRLNKKILIVTDELMKNGSLVEILRDYPNVHWCRNSVVEITNGIKKMLIMNTQTYSTEAFSRERGCLKLIQALDGVLKRVSP